MEMPIVDNEFLSLFLPEDSHFSTEDILNDFKFYIFRLMSLSLDSLIQEQINNEYECISTRKEFKTFFDEKITSVVDIISLHESLQKKIAIIQHSLEQSKNLIEDNSSLFKSSSINQEVSLLSTSLQSNKNLLGKHSILMDLISIPNLMINCFRNGCLDLYIEYNNYVKSIGVYEKKDSDNDDNDIIALIKRNVEKINNVVKVLIRKMLTNGNISLKNNPLNEVVDYKSEEIYEILELDSFCQEIFASYPITYSQSNPEINTSSVKRIIVILYSLSLYYENLNLFKSNPDANCVDGVSIKISISRFFNYCKEKVLLFSEIFAEENIYLNQFAKRYVIEKFILPIIKDKYFDPLEKSLNSGSIDTKLISYYEFNEKRENLENFFKELNLDLYNENENSDSLFINSLSTINEIIIENFFLNFEQILYFNVNSLKRYLAKIKDFRKLFAVENQLRNEFIFILQSNLAEMLKEIANQNLTSIKEKSRLFAIIEKNISSILSTIQDFFMDDFYFIKLSGQDSNGDKLNLINFKLLLLDVENDKGIIVEFMRNIYESQGLKKYWERCFNLSKKDEWKKFLTVNDE